MVGETFGHYRILSKLGAGGMGEVYRARDEHLGRDVAIKILPQTAERDEDALRRLTNEARAASALNHPCIVAIYEIGDAGGAPFIAMELVDGTTLRERLRDGPLPRERAIAIATQLAAALSAAHAAGLIHRDIKPENVIVRPDEYIKVLDFGLAALRPERPSGTAMSKLETVRATTAGTPAYMAPEQIDGSTDSRSDVFAFGVVLCELMTGVNPFARPTVLETLTAIGQTPTSAVPATSRLPADVRAIVLRCLERDPRGRYPSMGGVLADLQQLGAPAERTGLPFARRLSIVAGTVGVAVVAAASLWLSLRRDEPVAPPVQLTHFSTAVRDPAFSPDGRLLVYVVQEPNSPNTQLFVQPFPDGEPRQLTRTPDLKSWPAFSPDGSRIAYTVTGAEWKWDTWSVPLIGGGPQLLLRNAAALQWLPDKRVVFSEFKNGSQLGITIADESRAGARDVYVPPGSAMAHFSDVSPDGRRIAIGQMSDFPGTSSNTTVPLSCFVQPLDPGAAPRGAIGGSDVPCSMFVRSSCDGRSLFFASGRGSKFDVFRQPSEGGLPQRIVPGIAVLGVLSSFALTPDGRTIVYPGGETHEAIWIRSEDGDASQLTLEGNARSVTPLADGTRLLYIVGPRFVPGQIWVRTLDGTHAERLFSGFEAQSATPSRDGTRVAFTTIDSSGRGHLWIGLTDNSVAPRELVVGDADPRQPIISPDGATIFCAAGEAATGERIWRVSIDGGPSRPITDSEPGLQVRSVSPDSRWISLTRNGRTPRETWIVPADGSGPGRKLWNTWELAWAPQGFLLTAGGMITSAWLLPSAAGASEPPSLGENPTEKTIAEAGGRNVLTDYFSSIPSRCRRRSLSCTRRSSTIRTCLPLTCRDDDLRSGLARMPS